ncbi:hypothetical protein Bca52824_081349 [Brassica carinata]|uniref:Uncharacterized protein n=1 Tax=Brassica carinata TaxID=52824 RepID=A0A8X7PIJ4_BRACI|nr:hypothetical protein Bca52824_081349 [Brassica carinata]
MTTTNLTWMTVMDGDNLDEEWKAMVEEAMSDAKDRRCRLNVLRPQPKPSANRHETTSTHSADAAEPMEVDTAPMGRTLRKRKGKVAKHL